jgi:hypothetical protein
LPCRTVPIIAGSQRCGDILGMSIAAACTALAIQSENAMGNKPVTRAVDGSEDASFKPEESIEVEPNDPAYQHQEVDASQAPGPGDRQKAEDDVKKG